MSSRRGKVAIIGAGLGGLSAAACLAADGFEVAVFEKNPQIGGKLNLLERDGFKFDLGPSIIILPHLFRRVFERAGRRMADYVELQRLEPQWRSFFEDGTTIDLYGDADRMASEVRKVGEDPARYWEFIAYSRRLWEFAEASYLEPGADTVRDVLRHSSVLEWRSGTDPIRTVDSGVGRFVREQHLRWMLDFFIKYVGSSPYDAPALLNLMPYAQLSEGLWYVRGGLYNLARGFGRLLDELGVEVHLGAEVTRILVDGKIAYGVQLADGSEHRARAVVSNMEVIPAYERLLGEKGGTMMWRYRRQFAPACSGLVVHLGVNRRYPQLAHHNFFFSRNPREHFDAIHRRKVLPQDPTVYVVCPTATDRSIAPEGHEIIKLLPHIPHLGERPPAPEEYEALKERVLDKVERMGLTDLRRHVVVEDVMTPRDLERLYYSNRGSIYGVVSERTRNFALKAPKRSARFRNLYFVGGSVNPGGGTPMVVLAGQHVARIVGEDLASETIWTGGGRLRRAPRRREA